MKPLHIALLLTAGAAGGALVMMVAQYQPAGSAAQTAVQTATEPDKIPAGAQAISQPSSPATAPIQQPPVKAESAPEHPSPVVKAEVAKERRPSPWEAPKPGRTRTTINLKPQQQTASIAPNVRPTPPPVAAVPPAAT